MFSQAQGITYLQSLGIPVNEDGYAYTPDFNYRVLDGEIEVGVTKTFDRWANSVDARLTKLPKGKRFDFAAWRAAAINQDKE